MSLSNSAVLTGLLVFGQAASLSPGVNTLGAITPHGVELRRGNA